MVANLHKTSAIFLRVVIILTFLILLFSCSANRVADIDEHSSQSKYTGRIHKVASGETLFSIAWRYGVDYKKLADFNAISPPYTIYPSQKIKIDIRFGNGKKVGSKPYADDKKAKVAGGVVNKGASGEYRSDKRSSSVSESSKGDAFLSSPKWQWPASGKLIALFQGDSGLNKGIDLSGKLGEPVLAAASGRVVYAGSGLSGYGNLLIIKHNETFLSAYAHNAEISVKEGDFVKVGQRIADMGSSGTDRVKLHFEIRSEGSPVDPLKFLPKR